MPCSASVIRSVDILADWPRFFGPVLTLDHPDSLNVIVIPRQAREVRIRPESLHAARSQSVGLSNRSPTIRGLTAPDADRLPGVPRPKDGARPHFHQLRGYATRHQS
jgi:hypothetical protein